MFGCSQLIGTLDVQPLWDGQRAKRYGCSLFNTYIIVAKGRKHNVYEPRFYFPLRLVELTDVASSTGGMDIKGYGWKRNLEVQEN